MTGKEFLKRESIVFKIIYLIGAISFVLHFNEFTKGEEHKNILCIIIAFGSIIIFFVRRYISENRED